jgi:uncharacterized repeat protein (TIGR01451 family)
MTRVAWTAVWLITLWSAIGLSLLGMAPAHGSGSADVPNHDIRAAQTFFAYVRAGENLDVLVEKSYNWGTPDVDVVVTVSGPGGVSRTCTVTASAAVGASCDLPDLVSGTSGIWSVNFAPQCGSPTCSAPDRYEWTVEVQSGAAEIPGRVWSERYVFNQADALGDFTGWYQSQYGYTYRGTYLTYGGVDSTVLTTQYGNVTSGTCLSVYASANSSDTSVGQPDPTCGGVFKVFFERPAADLPATAARWDGTTDWVLPPIVEPSITNLAFTPSAPGSRGGTVTFNVANYTGPVLVQLDANGDNAFDGPTDRTVTVNVVTGSASIPFDGTDNGGSPIPITQTIGFRAFIDRVGEIHFVNSDVEVRGGIEVSRLNGPTAGRTTIYWNDTPFPWPDSNRCSQTSQNDGRAGVDSAGGVHGWPVGACGSVPGANPNDGIHGGWGDVRDIDDWTYVPVGIEQTLVVPGRGLVIEKSSTPAVADPGDVVTYTVTVTNSGDFSYTVGDPASFTDDLTDVLDDAEYNNDATATAGDTTYTAPNLTWTGPLPVGDTVTVTYSVTTNNPATGDLTLTNVVGDGDESNCRPGSSGGSCTTSTPIRLLRVTKIDNQQSVVAGDTVAYTVAIRNIGKADFTIARPATLTDDLSDVLDDAVYNNDATATAGAVSFSTPRMTWTGPIAVRSTVTVTYTVTTRNPMSGDGQIRNVVITPASNCELGCSIVTAPTLPVTVPTLPVTGRSLRTLLPMGIMVTIVGIAAVLLARTPTESDRRPTRMRD